MTDFILGGVLLAGSTVSYLYSRNRYQSNTNFLNDLRPKVVEINKNNPLKKVKDGQLIYVNDKVSYTSPVNY